MRYRHALILAVGLIVVAVGLRTTNASETLALKGAFSAETIPVIDLAEHGFSEPFINQLSTRGGVAPNDYATLQKRGAVYAAPQSTASFEIVVSNYDRDAHTYWVSETLPPELAFVSAENTTLNYNAATRQITWSGRIEPGHLDYIIEPALQPLPYIDLGQFGVPNICTYLINLYSACDDATLTYNFGGQNYSTSLFGARQRQLSLSTNGILLGGAENGMMPTHRPHWLPRPASPNFTVAPLWQDIDMPNAGRWHLAILQGFIPGHDVFYVQWHDAPHKHDPNITSRFAIAVVLDGEGGLDGHLFYFYDLVSNPAALAAQGYTIGIEDGIGSRGATFAHAPCCGDGTTPQGLPPTSAFTLHLKPHLRGSNYSKTLRYTAIVDAQVPETVVSTVTAVSDSADPTVNNVWSSHYLYVREQVFLPIVRR